MAYITLVGKSEANRAAALTDIWTTIEAMGWVLHDNLDENAKNSWSASTAYTVGQQVTPTTKNGKVYECITAGTSSTAEPTWPTTEGATVNDGTVTWKCYNGRTRVYKSNGELGDRINEYVKINWDTANVIQAQPAYYWNATTHAGVGMNTTTACQLSTSETGFYLWIYGNKNLVYMISKIATTYDAIGFGHLPKRYWTTLTTLTANASSGTNVTITVSSTAGFIAGQYYQIVGANGEGRDRVQVSSITSGTQMVIASLPRAYNSGAMIGQVPSTFGVYTSSTNAFYISCHADASGTTNINSSCSFESSMVTAAYIDPDYRGNSKYLLTPILISENTSLSFFGYIDEYVFNCPSGGLVDEDTLGVNQQDSGTAESGTSTTLTDNDKSWTTNAWAGKVIIITFGTGIGQIRKIASNTATAITVSEAWTITPDNTSQYVICDEGYRYFSIGRPQAYREAV